jgi:hypothetical protein
MASIPSSKHLASMLHQLQLEKEQRLRELAAAEEKKLQEEAEDLKRKATDLARKKQHQSEELKREEEDLKKLREAASQADMFAAEEQRISDLRQRMEEFRGNDNESLKSRLMAEGYGEALINQMLRLRTLDEQLDSPRGLKARYSDEENPLELAMERTGKIYVDRQVVDRLEGLRREAQQNRYLGADQKDELASIQYHINRFEQHPEYDGRQDQHYVSQASKTIEDIKRDLGFELNTSTLMYDGKRL